MTERNSRHDTHSGPPDDAGQPDGRELVDPNTGLSRRALVWNVLVFQLKLLADGLRDVLLSPLSLGAAVLGLLAGGREPDQYFQRVLHWGRGTERWINLFGAQRGGGTADTLMEPLREKAFEEAQNNPLVRKIESNLNEKLDRINRER